MDLDLYSNAVYRARDGESSARFPGLGISNGQADVDGNDGDGDNDIDDDGGWEGSERGCSGGGSGRGWMRDLINNPGNWTPFDLR